MGILHKVRKSGVIKVINAKTHNVQGYVSRYLKDHQWVQVKLNFTFRCMNHWWNLSYSLVKKSNAGLFSSAVFTSGKTVDINLLDMVRFCLLPPLKTSLLSLLFRTAKTVILLDWSRRTNDWAPDPTMLPSWATHRRPTLVLHRSPTKIHPRQMITTLKLPSGRTIATMIVWLRPGSIIPGRRRVLLLLISIGSRVKTHSTWQIAPLPMEFLWYVHF